MPRLLSFTAVVGLTLSTAAFGQASPPITRLQTLVQALPECTCRARGQNFALGQTVCLRTAQGDRLAECRMALNVTSWDMTERPCPES